MRRYRGPALIEREGVAILCMAIGFLLLGAVIFFGSILGFLPVAR